MKEFIYHVFNRGIKKQVIFKEEGDYRRFAYNLYRFNNDGNALRGSYRDDLKDWSQQKKIVEVLKWSLFPNHYHLLVMEKEEGGLLEFIKSIGNGYTKYSNIKYKESGRIFQNKTKTTLISADPQFLYIPFYIDLNPLDLRFSGWKRSCVSDIGAALDFVKNYRWSSLRNYLGESAEFEEIINKDAYYELYDHKPERYEEELKEWIKNIPELESFQ